LRQEVSRLGRLLWRGPISEVLPKFTPISLEGLPRLDGAASEYEAHLERCGLDVNELPEDGDVYRLPKVLAGPRLTLGRETFLVGLPWG
jgi:hypothetical protein